MIARAPLVAALWLTTGCSVAPTPAARAQSAADTRLFAMQSNFWVNLHHFLYVTARARKGLDATRATVTKALADTAGFAALPAVMRDAWSDALAYYTRAIAERDLLFDTALVTVNVRLSHVRGDSLGATRLDAELAGALERAAPAYRALWWPRHDAANKKWIADVRVLLAEQGDSAAKWEARVFGEPWAKEPVPVDVSAYANWAGAYTTADPSHVTVSSLNADDRGTTAFETLFHEVLHTMDDTLFIHLRDAARVQNKRMRRDPTHAFIFYTAGEVTRRLYPGYVPFAESGGIWQRAQDLGAMRPLLERHWQLWIDGKITLEEALRRIAGEM